MGLGSSGDVGVMGKPDIWTSSYTTINVSITLAFIQIIIDLIHFSPPRIELGVRDLLDEYLFK